MHTIKVSFCITTRNRALFLEATLANIIQQANQEIEIVVVDGASTDNTSEVVKTHQRRFNNIKYFRDEKNMGFNKDMATAIELARGEYCWIFSDDDMIKPGAVARILKEIKTGFEIYLCNISACNLSMQPYQDKYWLARKIDDKMFNLHNRDEFICYCNQANSIAALFSYWCSIILRRKAWMRTGFHHDFNGTAYALASSLLSFTQTQCRLKYIKDQLVFWRNDNESFQNAGGRVKRVLLDFDGYLQLADKYLLDDAEMRAAFLKVMTREHPWYSIVNIVSGISSPTVWNPFKKKMLAFGYSPRLVKICYLLGRNKKIVSIAVSFKRKIARSLLVNRMREIISLNLSGSNLSR